MNVSDITYKQQAVFFLCPGDVFVTLWITVCKSSYSTLSSSSMAVSISVLVAVVSLHLMAFVLAIGAERRRSTAKVTPDQYDDFNYCVYDSDASTAYGLSAFGLLLISQTVINGVTKCLCFGKGLVRGFSRTMAVFFFILSWVSFLGAEACLLAGSAKNAYHTKYRTIYGGDDLSCETLRKGVFAGGAALTFISMVASIVYYLVHLKADTDGWQKHENEGLGMSSLEHQDRASAGQFEKL
ncbi:hypothetical protein L1987_61774 [Smallanthus sonchifolius]|uniref:Uncharacterized protein n=1 Tax=Smallanthus sonchifolius TaxID=185202 RepID=A0ACB9C8V5_9ASTR|nr:hypothetical protein L1987_61774 [Smallanthus sonchifolius]